MYHPNLYVNWYICHLAIARSHHNKNGNAIRHMHRAMLDPSITFSVLLVPTVFGAAGRLEPKWLLLEAFGKDTKGLMS